MEMFQKKNLLCQNDAAAPKKSHSIWWDYWCGDHKHRQIPMADQSQATPGD